MPRYDIGQVAVPPIIALEARMSSVNLYRYRDQRLTFHGT